MTTGFTVVRHTVVADITDQLIDIYQMVYADRLDDPFFTTARFVERLKDHADAPRWEVAVGYHGTEPIGYAYGAARPGGTGYWSTLTPPPDDAFAAEDGARTFVLFELMILPQWRRTGASRAVHDALLAGRSEPRVSLAVEHDHPRVRHLYERWGYRLVGQRTPAPDSPIMDIMWRPRDMPDAPLLHTATGARVGR